jgi:DNA-binding SARP family transcriptional activator/tetratricopeptide (TPR) repeat protein
MTFDDKRRRFALLGPVRAWIGDAEVDLGPAQQRAVLAALLLREGGQAGVAQLADGLWGEHPPPSAVTTIRTYVYRLRRLLGESAIRSAGDGYAMDLRPGELDLLAFRGHVAAAEQARAAGDTAAVAKELEAGLGRWNGPPLPGLPGPYAAWQRAYLERLRAEADETRLRAQLDLGEHARLLPELTALVAERPLDERRREMLILALHRSGRTAEAVASYREGRARLADELGLDPGPALRAVYEQIRTGAAPADGLPPGPRSFTGRQAQLAAADALRAGPDRPGPVIALVVGTAGVGKTSFALHWAGRIAGDYPDGRICLDLRGFAPGGTPLDPADAVRTLLDTLGVPGSQLPAGAGAQLALYRSVTADRRLLLVLDNARDAAQVRPLLAGGPGTLIVVTSRVQLSGLVAADGARAIHLDVLEPAEARAMVAARIGADRVAAEQSAVADIVRACARLPLALAVVAARAAADPGVRLADVAAGLRSGADAFGALSWSYAALEARAARLFRLLALHPGPRMSLVSAAAAGGLGIGEARRVLDELCDAVVLDEVAPGWFAGHDLLRAYAKEVLLATEPAAERQAGLRRLFDHYVRTTVVAARLMDPHRALPEPPPTGPVALDLPETADEAREWGIAERATLLAVVAHAVATGFHRQAWFIAQAMEIFLIRGGHFDDRAAVQRLAVASARALGDRTREAQALLGLGRAHYLRGDFTAAARHTTDALRITRAIGDRGLERDCRMNLGNVASGRGEQAEAIGHFAAALDISEALGDSRGIAAAFNNLGYEYALHGDHDRAIDLCSRAIARWIGVGDRNGQAHGWDSIGLAHHRAGRYQTAVACLRHAVELFDELESRYKAAIALDHLGDACRSAGDEAGAVAAWQRAMGFLDESEQCGVLNGPVQTDEKTLRTKIRSCLDVAAVS